MPKYLIKIKVEELEEGGFLATSKDVQGLIAQGRTITETMESAENVAQKIIESTVEHGNDKFQIKLKRERITEEIEMPISVHIKPNFKQWLIVNKYHSNFFIGIFAGIAVIIAAKTEGLPWLTSLDAFGAWTVYLLGFIIVYLLGALVLYLSERSI